MNILDVDMRCKKNLFVFCVALVALIIYINLNQEISRLRLDKETLILQNLSKDVDITYWMKQLRLNKTKNLPFQIATIYAITPTYSRYVQKAELTRLSQTLALVPNIHWIVVEDSDRKTSLVTNLLQESVNNYTHLNTKTPDERKKARPRQKVHRGVEQRNLGLKWLRDNLVLHKDKGVVYFMDDDNTYDVKLFKEISKVTTVGVWPVGLVGGLNAELPTLDSQTGKVNGFKTGWKANRVFAIDMAGFALSLDLILSKPNAVFSYDMKNGLLENEFLSMFVTLNDLQPLADNCTKVYVWHTRTENPAIKGNVTGLEV